VRTSETELSSVAAELSGELRRRKNSVVISVSREKVAEAIKRISSLPGLYHLSTISGVDLGQEIEVLYHFWKGRDIVTVRILVPKADPHVQSVCGLLPSSLLYEAEVKDLLGVQFDGNPLMRQKLLLPDSYPEGAPPPLTKEADPEKIRKAMELE
jgi:membrane-bound hydrogenase subunit beta